MRCCISFLMLLVFVAGCRAPQPRHHFLLTIEVPHGMSLWRYELSDTALHFIDMPGVAESRISVSIDTSIADNDSLQLVAKLDPKSFSCGEQHALAASAIYFENDSGHFAVTPGINHPKELDIAVRIINMLVPEGYKLHFEDMQRAGDPGEKMNI